MKSYKVNHARAGQARVATLDAEGDKPLKQVRAAELLGIHAVTLNRIEAGSARVSLELLERMCVLYGCTRAYLLGEPELVDELEAARERIAGALTKVGSGLEELAGLVETLNDRAADSARPKVIA